MRVGQVTKVQVEPSIHPRESSVLDYIAQSVDSTLVMVAHSNRLALGTRILLIGHQNRNLGAQLGELEGACMG